MDVDLRNEAMLIRPYGTHTLKTRNSERTVPLSPDALRSLKIVMEGKASDAPLFRRYAGPRRSEGASQSLMKRLRTVVKDARNQYIAYATV